MSKARDTQLFSLVPWHGAQSSTVVVRSGTRTVAPRVRGGCLLYLEKRLRQESSATCHEAGVMMLGAAQEWRRPAGGEGTVNNGHDASN